MITYNKRPERSQELKATQGRGNPGTRDSGASALKWKHAAVLQEYEGGQKTWSKEREIKGH